MILLIKIFPVLIGLLCMILGLLPERYKDIIHPVIAEGEIISSVMQNVHQYGNDAVFLAPVVRYRTGQEIRTVTAKEFVPEWQYLYHTGSKIQICYDSAQPDKFVICHDGKAQFRKKILLTAGIGTLTAYAVLNLL